MNAAALLLLLTASYFTCSSSTCALSRAGQKELKYLIEPLVYAEVSGRRGENVTLPCILRTKPAHYNVKWTKLEPEHVGPQNIVIISNGHTSKPYGQIGPRASLRQAHPMDASLQLHHLELEDGGRYRCELINGIDDENVVVPLRIEGVVFPYQSKDGRYKFTFEEAKKACAEQDGILATFKQLFTAWTEGLDWCNAGWLGDGTVRYPVIVPRAPCGGELAPGIRSYGLRDKTHHRFDAFCFTSVTSGSVLYIRGPFSYGQAVQACKNKMADLALVGQLYSAWHFRNYDQCDGGWLKDGSVRFPISTPRKRCGGLLEPGIRSFGFPKNNQSLYGAFCYR
ncbi:hyaluronan and proteoglycan link protein 2 [Lampris incognitus]|uniref:hyaluronan and proteoglycan link protein 2 n=1 Tax=Lampris incognitus TaxID=2546036 RepID=UPI0024B4FE56|nr:hyaluronan and proteoglycan link protein 2 [Lampris incognitus]XP_056141855.1 hyaluronan and proteoglycan link protein 2 [Lampris incognitus]XP_056141856.1 hyaluronan and proteoglycan link protein 2 [Lampris incognitus]XP_056141857.1 hyaluronan and proteoglycan link protein 2 [Lampris incognitus]